MSVTYRPESPGGEALRSVINDLADQLCLAATAGDHKRESQWAGAGHRG